MNNIRIHIREYKFMGSVNRSDERIRDTGEVFTPTELVQKYINWLDSCDTEAFTNVNARFCDNSCGDGQFLGEIIIKKMEGGSTFEQALSTTYGVDYQISNVDLCRERLLCGHENLRHIVEKNIVCADALNYDYSFDGTWEKNQARLKEMGNPSEDLFE